MGPTGQRQVSDMVISISTVIHSPINELFAPQVWEYWAMLLAIGFMVLLGHGVAQQEDRDRALRRQRGQSGRSRHPSAQAQPQPSRPRQRAVSYDIRSDRLNLGAPGPNALNSGPLLRPSGPLRPGKPRPSSPPRRL